MIVRVPLHIQKQFGDCVNASITVYFKLQNCLMWQNHISPLTKMEMDTNCCHVHTVKVQNLCEKRKANMNEWKDRARMTLRNAVKPYVT